MAFIAGTYESNGDPAAIMVLVKLLVETRSSEWHIDGRPDYVTIHGFG